MNERIEHIKASIAQKAQRLTEEIPFEEFDQLQTDIAHLEAELEQEQAKQMRVQVQEEKVQSIQLPHNFDEVFGDPRANEIITEVIREFQRQAYEEHNAEVEQLIARNQEESRAATDRELQLQRQNKELQDSLEAEHKQAKRDAQEFVDLEHKIAQLQLEQQDAESKRDAAARELETAQQEINRLNSHIDDLRKEIAVGAKEAHKVTDIGSNNKLNALVKQSLEEKVNRGLERWSKMMPDVIAPPEITVSPFRGDDQADNTTVPMDEPADGNDTASHTEVIFRDQVEGVQSGADSGDHADQGQTVGTLAERVGELEKKVEYIQRHLFSVEAPETQVESIKESA